MSVRRLRVDYESHAVALDCNELGALLVAAGLGSPPEHALISLLALNGLLLAVYHDLSDEHREHMKSQGVDPADYVDADHLGLLLGDEFRSSCTRSSRASTAAR